MLHDPIIALIRTFVPSLVGTLIAWSATKGIGVDDATSAAVTSFLIALTTAAYYAFATLLERKVDPAFGWLLGVPKTPSYSGEDTNVTRTSHDSG